MNRIRIDPYEILYLAVAVATFNHTTWAGAFLFEGIPPIEPVNLAFWYLKGALLATAIDLGMWTTSRSLLTAQGGSVIVLVVAFVIASLGSFFAQLVYILAHTPQYVISDAVSPYWVAVLQPLTDARVILLPALLPTLAIVYTLARIWRRKDEIQQLREAQDVTVVESTAQLIDIAKETPELLEMPELLALPAGANIDFEKKRFWDDVDERWRGPYKTKRRMLSVMKMLETRRRRKREKEERAKSDEEQRG